MPDAIVAFFAKYPVVIHIRGIFGINLVKIRSIRILLFGFLCKQIITVDNQSKKEIENLCSIFKNKVIFIPNGIPILESQCNQYIVERYIQKI